MAAKVEKNLLVMRPCRNREHELLKNNLVRVLVPKFGDNRLGDWIMARMKKPSYYVNLDDFGSFVWLRCDGETTVKEIGEALKQHFGDDIESVYDRLGLFFTRLEKGKLIVFKGGDKNE